MPLLSPDQISAMERIVLIDRDAQLKCAATPGEREAARVLSDFRMILIQSAGRLESLDDMISVLARAPYGVLLYSIGEISGGDPERASGLIDTVERNLRVAFPRRRRRWWRR